MTDKPKRGRGRPPSQHNQDWREFDALLNSNGAMYLRTPEAQGYAAKINGAVSEGLAAALASSRASYVLHNSPSPGHNKQQIELRQQRVAEVAQRLSAASAREVVLTAVALARVWRDEVWATNQGEKYPARTLADYIREARNLTLPN